MSMQIYQFKLIQAIRLFFNQKGFTDILSPPMVENPGMETHIHPFEVYSAQTQKTQNLYLHSSPEFYLKGLLSQHQELKEIFSINYVFRDEPTSPIHRPQFLMLEWYRRNAFYSQIMQDTEDLIKYLQDYFSADQDKLKASIQNYQRTTVSELIHEFANFEILDFLDKKDLKQKIKADFTTVPLPDSDCSWDDYYFLFFLNIIEPHLKKFPYLLINEFPAPLCALATINQKDPRVCDRFEVYLSGIELCNAFNELTDYNEQKNRFELQAKEKKGFYGYQLPWPKEFMQHLKAGYPKSSGIAMGIDRLFYSLFKVENPFCD